MAVVRVLPAEPQPPAAKGQTRMPLSAHSKLTLATIKALVGSSAGQQGQQ
jgi:hypothetical protein